MKTRSTAFEIVIFVQISSIGRSDNKNMMQFLPFENEIRPRVVHTLQAFLFVKVKIFVLITQSVHI